MKQIYKITNIKNNKSYVGIVISKGKNYVQRFHEHMTGKGGVYLWNELQVGCATIEDFIVELLEEGTQDDVYFKNKEEFYIEQLNTLWPNGYNGNKGNYIVQTPEIKAKVKETIAKNKAAGKVYGKKGIHANCAVYCYPDGTIKCLPIEHEDVVNKVVKHINYKEDSKGRLQKQQKIEQRSRNNGLTDKQVAFSARIKELAKQFPNLESWQKGREKFKNRMAKKEFTEKEKDLYYKRRPQIVKQQWEKLSKDEKDIRTSPGLNLMNASYKCEHCGIMTNKGNYHRWHGDKCKKVK